MKKLLSLLFTLSLVTFTLTACDLSGLSGFLGSAVLGSSDQTSEGDVSSFVDSSFVQSSDSSSGSSSSSSSNSSSNGNSSNSSNSSSSSSEEEKPAELLILEAAYKLEHNEYLLGTYTMTGVVTDVEKRSQGDICLTFVIGGYTQYPMYCYWLQDADFIQESDTITVKGPIKRHYDKVEFERPDLLSYKQAGGSSSGSGSGGSTDEDIEILKNDGKGLPTGTNGVYNVDFTKATNVKTVANQGYFLDGCPTTGNVKVLVVPVQFKDVTASSKGYSIDAIEKAFNGSTGDTDYYSVRDYYYKSSYGKLNLQFDVLDSWFTPAQNSSYYLQATMDIEGQDIECGDQIIIDEVLKSLESKTDLSSYDADGNDIIDAIVLINTLEINYDVTLQWAYRYWNMYTDSDGYYYEYDGVSANDYLWASYQFLFEGEDGDFDDTNAMNTYTYIHEFGHVLGADDYYDTAYVGSPMGGNDIMDSASGDHNAYSKFNYGWLKTSRLVTAKNSVTLTLEKFSKNGDTIIIANNWDETLGAYQEYFVLVYYTNEGLNGGAGGYFDDEGIVVYHINSTLYKETYEGKVYYDVYNNNTDPSDEDGYGTENNLVEFVKTSGGGYVYKTGATLAKTTKTDGGDKIAYTFTVNAISGDFATITFTKNN